MDTLNVLKKKPNFQYIGKLESFHLYDKLNWTIWHNKLIYNSFRSITIVETMSKKDSVLLMDSLKKVYNTLYYGIVHDDSLTADSKLNLCSFGEHINILNIDATFVLIFPQRHQAILSKNKINLLTTFNNLCSNEVVFIAENGSVENLFATVNKIDQILRKTTNRQLLVNILRLDSNGNMFEMIRRPRDKT